MLIQEHLKFYTNKAGPIVRCNGVREAKVSKHFTAANVADDIQNGHNWFGICVHNNVMHFPAKSRWSLAHGLVGHFYGCMVATSSVDSCRYIQYTISCSSPYYCWQMWVSTSAASNLFNTTIRGDSSSALLATLTLVVVHPKRFYQKRQPLLHKI